MGEPILFHSALSPEESARRIQAELAPWWAACVPGLVGTWNPGRWLEFRPRAVLGKIRNGHLRLWALTPGLRNPGSRIFYGMLLEDGTGTRLEGRFDIHPVAKAFTAIWFGGLALFVVLAIVLSFGEGSREDVPVVLAAIGAMGLFGWLLVRLGTWMAPRERAYILEFLGSTLEAKPWIPAAR